MDFFDNATLLYDDRLPSGAVLQNGRYRIVKVLAQGGFGITYLAEDFTLWQNIVIKEYYNKEWHTRDSATSYVSRNVATKEMEGKFRKKFEKEAFTIMQLTHPNIVKVFDFFEENGTMYYTMSYNKFLNKINGDLNIYAQNSA